MKLSVYNATGSVVDEIELDEAVFGVPANTEQEVFDRPHSFWGKRGLPFLARSLG